ncbi:unnamed protein product [Cylicostephanus goldi]|uniref:DNA polymerase alpha subunit B OB domain-containing protein n=1 Tax=Cylicostephanus goldi TaxID=71465 RepID=A0A3P7N720_CYLGO|nr:unnamed protein product [Cylicostephanus goldi]
MDDENGTVIELDLTRLNEVSVFPGQLVAYYGSFEGGERFVAAKQFQPSPLKLSPLRRPPSDGKF